MKENKEMTLLKFVLAFVTAGVTVVAFAYSTFETKDHVTIMRGIRDAQYQEILKRLDREDDKLDRLLKRD